MARHRVTIKTVVNVAQDVEAETYEEALRKAADATDFYQLFRVRNIGAMETSWAEEHAYAGVDTFDSEGRYDPEDPAIFDAGGPTGWTRRKD